MINNTWKTAQKIVVTSGLMGTLLFSTACGGSNTDAATPAPESESTVSSSASPTASPSPVVTEDATANVIDGIPVKEGIVSNGRGEYRQTTITDDDPAMKYDPAKATEFAKTNFTPEELAEAQKVAVKFLAEEGLDSTVNGGEPADFDAWWEKHNEIFHPVQREAIYNNYKADPEKSAVILTSSWRDGKYDFDYSEVTRVKDRKINITSVDGAISPTGVPYVMIKGDVSFKSPILVQGAPSAEQVTGKVSYSMLKDTDGKWKIVGFGSEFNAVETIR